jgi:hypothetical protein
MYDVGSRRKGSAYCGHEEVAMGKKKMLAVALCATTVMGVSGNAAFAQGQVEQGPEHANSICSFSGLNDTPDDPAPEGGRVQSYGQLVQQDALEPSVNRSGGESPGNLCNPNNLPLK